MLRRLLIIAASTAVFGCVLVSCGDSAESGETLRWRSAVDVPVNFLMKVGNDLDYAELLPEVDCEKLTEDHPSLFIEKGCEEMSLDELMDLLSLLPDDPDNPMPDLRQSYLVDLGSGTIPTTSDVMDFLRKLDSTKIEYSVGVTNNTIADLTFYGMLFRKNDSLASMAVDTFFNIIASDSTRGGRRINVLGDTGLSIKRGKTGRYDCLPLQGEQLGDLVINQKQFSWRWLVKLEKSEFDGMRDTASTTDNVDIKLRIRFSGVNSIDSLFTL
jgi:hypothetical protein